MRFCIKIFHTNFPQNKNIPVAFGFIDSLRLIELLAFLTFFAAFFALLSKVFNFPENSRSDIDFFKKLHIFSQNYRTFPTSNPGLIIQLLEIFFVPKKNTENIKVKKNSRLCKNFFLVYFSNSLFSVPVLVYCLIFFITRCRKLYWIW